MKGFSGTAINSLKNLRNKTLRMTSWLAEPVRYSGSADLVRKINRCVILLFIFIILPLTVSGQVEVEKSRDKVIISGKQYYIHVVRKGETAYSISRAYGVTVDELIKNNTGTEKGVKTGQALRIPVVETPSPGVNLKAAGQTPAKQKDESKFFYHKLKPGETVYSLARNYGVSVQEITDSNPGVEINKLPVGYEIAIPRRTVKQTSEEIQVQEKGFLEHRVVKGETLSSIAEKYGISVRDIRRENKGVIFPHVNDILRIPVTRAPEVKEEIIEKADTVISAEKPLIEVPVGITPVKNLKGEFNVAVLLPFNTYENSIRTETDSSQIIKGKPVYKTTLRPDEWIYPQSVGFIELYQGILLAADTLRSLGLDINIFAYDTQNDDETPEKLIENGSLRNMDLIIGPVYSRNLVKIAEYAERYRIPVVSPVNLISNQPLAGNPNLFMAIPSVEVAQDAIIRKAAECRNSNFVFIHTDSSGEDEATIAYRNKLIRELDSAHGPDTLRFRELLFISRSALPADSINRLEHTLSLRHENVIIIASEDHPVLSEIIMSLHSLSRKYQIKLIGLPAVRELVNLDPKLYFDLGIELFSYYWIDYNKPDVKAFLKKYRNKYLTEPVETSYAWIGYDILYYFLSGLSIHGKDFIRHPEIHNPELLQTKFYFNRKNEDNGFENYHLYLIKYTGSMDIVLIEDR